MRNRDLRIKELQQLHADVIAVLEEFEAHEGDHAYAHMANLVPIYKTLANMLWMIEQLYEEAGE